MIFALGGAFFADACVGDEPATDSSDSGADTSTADGSTSDATPSDGASTDAGPTYTASLADDLRWEKFDVASLANGGFQGGAFDGRYVYFVPNANPAPPLVRYDTQGLFTDVASWDSEDLGGAQFAAALFVSPYLYLIPDGPTPGPDGTLVRYDTTKDFKSPGSYESFDLKANVNPSDRTFAPSAFDGKFAYLGPVSGTNAVRYDTTAPFDVDASYKSVSENSGGGYYSASCFDGNNIYFIPATLAGQPYGLVKQLSKTASFTNPASFVGFDVGPDAGIDPTPGYNGCAFDGRYLYLEPYGIKSGNQGFASLVVRYDTTAAFTSAGSYSKYDLSGVDTHAHGFHGATFDGRYLYFAPHTTSTAVRFDTTGGFADKASWQSYDLTTTLSASAQGYSGAVFDGRYVYLVPNATSLAVRFDAKSPPSLPSFASSFY